MLTSARRKNKLSSIIIKKRTRVFFENDVQILSKNSIETHQENQIRSSNKHIPPPSKPIKSLYDQLVKVPVISRSSIVSEMKCLMSQSQIHPSYLLSKKLVAEARAKLCKANLQRDYQFNEDSLEKLIEIASQKPNDSIAIVEAYQSCLSAQNYPVSVKLLLLYLGVFLYSVNAMYDLAEENCQEIYNQLVRNKTEQYLIIYLLLVIKLKTNLSEWGEGLKYLTKLLAFAWMYKLVDLESWCYFELSRVHFFMQEIQESNFFQKKSEMSVFQPEDSIYRGVVVCQLREELETIKQQNYNFSFNNALLVARLASTPKQTQQPLDFLLQKRKMQSSLRQVQENCKIRHVGNLLSRISNTTPSHATAKQGQTNAIPPCNFSGNPLFITHQSHIKNLNMYFRIKKQKLSGRHIALYTMENSSKSWVVMKEMLRNILLEMRSIINARNSMVV